MVLIMDCDRDWPRAHRVPQWERVGKLDAQRTRGSTGSTSSRANLAPLDRRSMTMPPMHDEVGPAAEGVLNRWLKGEPKKKEEKKKKWKSGKVEKWMRRGQKQNTARQGNRRKKQADGI